MPPENYEDLQIGFVKVEQKSRIPNKNIIKIIVYFILNILSALTAGSMFTFIKPSMDLGYTDNVFYFTVAVLICGYFCILCIGKIQTLSIKEKKMKFKEN